MYKKYLFLINIWIIIGLLALFLCVKLFKYRQKVDGLNKNLSLGKEKISKLFFSYAIPSTLSMLVVSLYNIADGIFITRGVGSDGVAAVNIGYPIINFTVALSLMFGIGGATLIAFRKHDIE